MGVQEGERERKEERERERRIERERGAGLFVLAGGAGACVKEHARRRLVLLVPADDQHGFDDRLRALLRETTGYDPFSNRQQVTSPPLLLLAQVVLAPASRSARVAASCCSYLKLKNVART